MSAVGYMVCGAVAGAWGGGSAYRLLGRARYPRAQELLGPPDVNMAMIYPPASSTMVRLASAASPTGCSPLEPLRSQKF